MQALPLLAVDSLDASIANYQGVAMSAGQFIAEAQSLALALPRASHAINLAENRYHFLLGWAAACLRQQVTLLPSSQAAGVLTNLQHEYPRHHVIDDQLVARFLEHAHAPAVDAWPAHWQLPADRVVAIAFTSGSTGAPQAYAKTWRSLFQNARLAADEVLGGTHLSIVATVPPQHMYGLEASLVAGLSAGCCLYDRKPFFPADVRNALESMPAPRTLVTTPAHLKVLVEANVGLPALHRVVSATAPLPVELAARVEAAWNTQVCEIYGCTEAGVVAHRRTTQSECWRTFSGGTVATVEGVTDYRAPQLSDPAVLQDVVESCSSTQFYLRGRAADMVKVAGKRTSLQELTRQLLAVPGIVDAVVFVPDPDARPAALVVAPEMTTNEIITILREQMDIVLMPRPLLLVERLPRNAVGKLPQDALLQALAESRSSQRPRSHERLIMNDAVVTQIVVPADHPALSGHFPGRPVVPGVVLLDAVLASVQACRRCTLRSIASAKFLHAVLPGEQIDLRIELVVDDAMQGLRARFQGRRDAAIAFEGTFVLTDADGVRS